MLKNLLVEFIGAFFLVLVVGMTVIPPGNSPLAPLAIGTILAVMVYAGGQFSGGHYNPAVTLAACIRGACRFSMLFPYWVAQLGAASVASILVLRFKAETAPQLMRPEFMNAFIAEFIGTFALCYMVLATATSKKSEGNSFYGFAIGFTVFACATALGGISGGAFNPAVALGLGITGIVEGSALCPHLIAELCAAGLAAAVFRVVSAD
jgi:aquaporin Z